MVMELVSRLSFTNHSNSETFLVVHTWFSQDGCQREGFWEVGHVVSPLDLSHSSGWWRLISPVFLTRTSCPKTTHANGYHGAWPGWVVSVSVLPLTTPSYFFFFFFLVIEYGQRDALSNYKLIIDFP